MRWCARVPVSFEGTAKDRALRCTEKAKLERALAVMMRGVIRKENLKRLPAGHWRQYDSVLGEAFAVLAPVAERLGYPRS